MRLRERRASLSPVLAVVVAALPPAACGGTGSGSGPIVTDSAGVRIIDNTAPAWSAREAWRIGADPLLELGADESGPAGFFERVAGVVLLPDGGLVAGDEGAAEIRAFDDTGALRWRAGRPGDGPGEFRLLAALGSFADSIWVFDFGNRRFTLLDRAGTPARTFTIGARVSAPAAVGRLADGRFVVREMWGAAGDAGAPATGLTRDPAAIVALWAGADRLDTIAVYPGREVWITVENGRGVMSTPLFARNTSSAIAGDDVLIGDQAAFAIDVVGADGALRRSIRISGLDLRVTGEVLGRAADALLEGLPRAERPARRAFLESLPGPASRPAFGRILVAATGEIWVSEHATPPGEPAAWYVFDEEGRWLGTVAMPERFRLEAVAADRVAGVWRDAYDVEHVRVHALDRRSG